MDLEFYEPAEASPLCDAPTFGCGKRRQRQVPARLLGQGKDDCPPNTSSKSRCCEWFLLAQGLQGLRYGQVVAVCRRTASVGESIVPQMSVPVSTLEG
jgi:hypothetical protein